MKLQLNYWSYCLIIDKTDLKQSCLIPRGQGGYDRPGGSYRNEYEGYGKHD